MAARSDSTTITTQGGLLSSELLIRLAQQPESVSGTRPDDYHLPPARRLRDAINRSWTDLQGSWATFRAELAKLPEGDRATTTTRERWLLPLFAELGYGRLQRSTEHSIDGRAYPISHAWGAVPIHLLGADIDLSHRTKGVAGAATAAPHLMVQEFLNRSDAHLWGMVSNGRRLRLLRDNTSLTRAAYVEFDLEAIFEGQVFTDFAVLWMTCHESRVEGDPPSACWLERWVTEARAQGVRALDSLRNGFERAITALGGGFLAQPNNGELRHRLRDAELTVDDYHRQVLRLVYRLVFLLVAEDRDLLHPPEAAGDARDRYARHYSMSRVRDHARRHRGGRHGDFWESLKPVFAGLDHQGLPELAVPALGSFLWSATACPDLDHAQLANRNFLAAVRALAFTERDRALHRIDFANLGPEELGSVYESLLELHPRIEADAARFELVSAAGNERKTSGSYYTPTSLISKLLDSALEPVLDEAAQSDSPEEAILDLKVLDPACGSGHFLIAAAQRIAARLAAIRARETTAPPEAIRHALREVVGRCLYGIDVNPMALELAKVNLWLEAVEPGRPLSFLDHHLVCGNALLGATPDLLSDGIPDDAFKPLTGDDKATVIGLRKRNKAERAGQGNLFTFDLSAAAEPLVAAIQAVDAIGDETVADVDAKAGQWRELVESGTYRNAVFVADLWCTAFVAPKVLGAAAVTEAVYETAQAKPDRVHEATRGLVESAARRYGFLHWHLAFLDVFGADDGRGGFDLVLGNPPWERVKLSEREFFASRAPEIASAVGAIRKALIAKLRAEDPALWDEFRAALRQAEGESHLLRTAGRFPLCGRGDVNTYAVFAEAMRDALAPRGRMGVIVPTGIATDDTTKHFFADCVDHRRLVSLYDFENAVGLFEGVGHGRFKFCLLTLGGQGAAVSEADFAFFAHHVTDLDDRERRFTLTPDDFALINPNTRTAPVFRTRRDAELTKKIYQRVPVLVRDGDPAGNPWGVDYQRMFDMTNDSHLFRTADELTTEGAILDGNVWRRGSEAWLPLYEAKMAHHFTHRWGDYSMKRIGSQDTQLPDIPDSQLAEPGYTVQPRYWVVEPEVHERMRHGNARWLLGFRDICRNTDERTMIAAALPVAAIGNKLPLLNPTVAPEIAGLLPSVFSSFAHDFTARQKIGGTSMNFFIAKQLAVLPPEALEARCDWSSGGTVAIWLTPRALELTYTAWDIQGFAADLGWDGPPFRWDPERRETLRAELDAAFFHLYGLERYDVDYVMDTFPIVRRKDEVKHGEFRTKRLILERYDAMSAAIDAGDSYLTPLIPGPADRSCAHDAPSSRTHEGEGARAPW